MLFVQLIKEQYKKVDSQASEKKNKMHNLLKDDVLFSDKFLIKRPLLEAFQSTTPVVFLIDEIDRTDREIEALLLEALSEAQITIPEIGTIKAKSNPLVIITSNNTRELSEALRRRCLYFKTDYPSITRELNIVKKKIPNIDDNLAKKAVEIIQYIRKLNLQKHPSIAETLDWIKALLLMNVETITPEIFKETMNLLLKNKDDMDLVQQKKIIPHLIKNND
ncbi:MAG: AAA family ATPase [Candidatus Helarchaeota archaeon]